jgi:hypothetical protein
MGQLSQFLNLTVLVAIFCLLVIGWNVARLDIAIEFLNWIVISLLADKAQGISTIRAIVALIFS